MPTVNFRSLLTSANLDRRERMRLSSFMQERRKSSSTRVAATEPCHRVLCRRVPETSRPKVRPGQRSKPGPGPQPTSRRVAGRGGLSPGCDMGERHREAGPPATSTCPAARVSWCAVRHHDDHHLLDPAPSATTCPSRRARSTRPTFGCRWTSDHLQFICHDDPVRLGHGRPGAGNTTVL